MKNFLKTVAMVIVFFALQTTMVSCADDSNIIKDEQNVEQIQNESRTIAPGNVGEGDDDDEETGSNI